MAKAIVNFNPGPAAVPREVLQIVQSELLDYRETGISILESSHRSPEYDEINEQTMALVRELLGLGEDYHVLFMTGGASTQFALIPLNFLNSGQVGAYIDTGTWSSKAFKECEIQGQAHIVFSSKDEGYRRVPRMDEIIIPENAAYVHMTSNNTIKGTQFHHIPDTGKVPLVCDMSSDIASMRRWSTKESGALGGDPGHHSRRFIGEGQRRLANHVYLQDICRKEVAVQHASGIWRLLHETGSGMDQGQGRA